MTVRVLFLSEGTSDQGLVSHVEGIAADLGVAVTVSAPELAGQEAYVTLSAVDVGILNITRFPVPDAARHFFAQRRLGVDAYDVYGRVIESFEGGTARIRFGGDMAPLAEQRRLGHQHALVRRSVRVVAGHAAVTARRVLPEIRPAFLGMARRAQLRY